MNKAAWILVGTLAAVAIIIVGVVLVDLRSTYAVCEGDVYMTEPCEAGELRRSLFGAMLAGAGIIAAAILLAALILRPRGAGRNGAGAA